MSLWMGALVRSMQPDSGHNPILEAAAYSERTAAFPCSIAWAQE